MHMKTIKSERQYEITKSWAARFEALLADSAQEPPPETERDRMLWEVGRAGVGGILNTLREEIREYESRQAAA